MEKRWLVLLSALLVLSGTFSLHSFGDDTDPLISKSYFEKKMAELEKKIEKEQSTVSTGGAKFAPVYFSAGETIIFKEGTEFILRSGEAQIVDPSTNGMPDITDGSNLANGSVLPVNHMLLCPRSDNRGIYCDTEIWLMIKGDYSKKQQSESQTQSETKDDNLNNEEL